MELKFLRPRYSLIFLLPILYVCDVLRDLVPLVQFKKHEKHSWRSVAFSKVAGFWPATLVKVTLLPGCFSPF